jgi:hypothetical protein
VADPRGASSRSVLLGVAALAIAGLLSIPLWLWSARRASRDEVVRTVESIRVAEIENRRAFGEYVGADAAPRAPYAVDATPVPWVPGEGFERLHWRPPSDQVLGSFRVVLTASGFVVHGACDVDGDGERALIEATESAPARLLTPPGVY